MAIDNLAIYMKDAILLNSFINDNRKLLLHLAWLLNDVFIFKESIINYL